MDGGEYPPCLGHCKQSISINRVTEKETKMGWKFWNKKTSSENRKRSKPSKPQEMPELVGRHLVVELGEDPDWVWRLKTVQRRREDGNSASDIRVFSTASASVKGVSVENYDSLDEHPDLILFEGWFDKGSRSIAIEKMQRV
jgi:hypothetical protein